MSKTAYIKRNLIKKIFGLFSFTSALFIFQACYGVPQDYHPEHFVEGTVKSRIDKLPIEGIFIEVNGSWIAETDSMGKFTIGLFESGVHSFNFSDHDDKINGRFAEKDSTISITSEQETVSLDVLLDPI